MGLSGFDRYNPIGFRVVTITILGSNGIIVIIIIIIIIIIITIDGSQVTFVVIFFSDMMSALTLLISFFTSCMWVKGRSQLRSWAAADGSYNT